MEASALRAPANISRLSISLPLLRLRSDEQLVALFRAGSDSAFQVIHDRYRQRLFAYVRQMLSAHSRQDAEDVLQDVFVRAFGALRADQREVNVRAWLYRVAHNRCIDHLRRPVPAPAEVFEMSRTPLHDPVEVAQRRDDLRRLVQDVGRLPEQQRSALLMREIDGMSYADLAAALDVTVPAVKSLLVRARVGLVEAAEARSMDCGVIREDLLAAYDRGVKASGRARRHMRECSGCREYRTALRGVRTSFAALSPGVAGPLAVLAKLGLSGGAAAGGSAAAGGGGGAVAGGVAAGATACKVAAVVCTAAITAGGAVEVKRLASERSTPASERAAEAIKSTPPLASRDAVKSALTSAAATAPAPISATVLDRPAPQAKAKPDKQPAPATTGEAETPAAVENGHAGPGGSAYPGNAEHSGGVSAPVEDPAVSPQTPSDSGPAPSDGPGTNEPAPPGTAAPAEPEATGPAAGSSPAPSSGGATPPSQH